MINTIMSGVIYLLYGRSAKNLNYVVTHVSKYINTVHCISMHIVYAN